MQNSVLNFINMIELTGLDPRFKAPQKSFPEILSLGSRPVLKFNDIVEVPYRVLNFNTGRDPRFKIQGSTEKFP